MQENTNKSIVVNSLILYCKMGVSIICGLFTTRFSLQALGVEDFGLFSVLGGIISFIGLINTIQVSTSNRFIAVAIGKGNICDINKQFNVNLVIHIAIALLTLLVAFPIGDWYIHHYINYDGDIQNAMMVFSFTIVASVITFIGVPYNGLLMAKEKFIVFSGIDVVSYVLKLIFTYLLISHWENKLLLYTIFISFLSAYPVLVYIIYCREKWRDITKLSYVKDKQAYSEVFSFSGWVAYGAVACVAKSQGAALVINMFFNTVMNTALGIANMVNSYMLQFAQNITQPIAPQITKSYASGNAQRTDDLLVLSTKASYIIMFLFSAPFLVEAEWILKIWLGEVPEYSVIFLKLLIVDGLISSFNSGISNLIFASGKIKLYQISVNTIKLIAVVVAYFALKAGAPVYALFLVYIFFSIIVVAMIQVVLHKTLNYDNTILWKRSYIPSLIITALFIPVLFVKEVPIHPLIMICLTIIYVAVLSWIIVLSNQERLKIVNFIKSKLLK